MPQGVQKQIGILAAIKPECHFLKVCREMFCADLVPRSHDAALEQRECGFDRIGMSVAINIDPAGMLDCFVFRRIMASAFHRVRVCAKVIRHQDINIGRNIFFDVLRQRAGLHIFRMEETEIAATLPNADNDFFVVFGASTVTAAKLSADICFVNFNRTVQHWLIAGSHCLADAMAEIPSCLVADSHHALDLVCAHPLAGLAHQVSDRKPFDKWQVGIVEDAASGHRELIIAILAIQKFFREPRKLLSLAARAFRAIRPAETLKKFSAFFISRKQILDIYNRHMVLSNG